MDQRFEGVPKATIRLEGRTVVRSAVANDWGSQLLWHMLRGDEVVASANARLGESFDFAGVEPGKYDVVLQMFKYEGYAKDPAGKFTVSKFIDVSDKVAVTV